MLSGRLLGTSSPHGAGALTLWHNYTTIRVGHRIIVLRDGIIAEQGGFAELLRRGGIFADYYQTQFAPEHAAEAGLSVPA